MATKGGIGRAFVLLRRAYPDHVQKHLANEDDMAEQLDFYARFFQDVPDDVLLAATEAHIGASQWFPKISELREHAFDILCHKGSLPSAFEAWAEVKCQLGYPYKQRQWSTPLVPTAMEHVGGMQAFGMSGLDDEPAWRARFYQAYETLIMRERAKVEMLPEVRAVADRYAGQIGADKVPELKAE